MLSAGAALGFVIGAVLPLEDSEALVAIGLALLVLSRLHRLL